MVSHVMRRFSSGVTPSERSTSSRRDLTTITATGTRRLWRTMNCEVGPVLDLGAAAARAAKESERHGAGIDRIKRRSEIGDELVGASEADLGVADAEGRHALEQ